MAKARTYDRHLRVLVTSATRDRLDALEREHPESMGEIVRQALEIGLPRVEVRLRRRTERRGAVGAP